MHAYAYTILCVEYACDATNMVFYSQSARFVNTSTLNMHVSMPRTGFTSQNA